MSHLFTKIKVYLFRRKYGFYPNDILRKLGMKIGSNVHIYARSLDLPFAYFFEIGDNVTISSANLLAHDASTKSFLGYTKAAKTIIGNNVFIGADSILLPNICIGDNVIVGAGTVVSKNIPSNSVVVGNPFRIIGTYKDYVKKNGDLFSKSKVFGNNKEKMSSEKLEKIAPGSWVFVP